MSENPTLIKNYTATGTIGDRRIVKFGSNDGEVVQATAATEDLLGVCRQPFGVVSGDRVDVALAGIVEVEAGGNITRGALVTADANGKAVAATRHTHTENTAGAYAQNATTGAAAADNVIGRALVSAASGDFFPVLLSPAAA